MNANPPPLSPQDLKEMTGISDESLERLEAYIWLLEKWQKHINLVGGKSLKDVWRRHVLDSAQLLPLIPSGTKTVLDMGSGGGFPGMVLAILGDFQVHLVESDGRKCAFLNEANRAVDGKAVVHNCRIENMNIFNADYVTARGCANIPKLLEYAYPFIESGGKCLFLKGQKAQEELTKSAKLWKMSVQYIQSISDSSGAILKLEGISRRHG